MSAERPTPPLPPLTADEFNNGAGYTFRGVPVIEHEDGDSVYAYGHVDPDVMADAVNDFYDEVGDATLPEDRYTAEDVRHTYAVTIEPSDGPDGWLISWATDIGSDTPGAFPLTVVDR